MDAPKADCYPDFLSPLPTLLKSFPRVSQCTFGVISVGQILDSTIVDCVPFPNFLLPKLDL